MNLLPPNSTRKHAAHFVPPVGLFGVGVEHAPEGVGALGVGADGWGGVLHVFGGAGVGLNEDGVFFGGGVGVGLVGGVAAVAEEEVVLGVEALGGEKGAGAVDAELVFKIVGVEVLDFDAFEQVAG